MASPKLYFPDIQYLVDWNNTGFAVLDDNSDVSPYVTQFSADWGMGVRGPTRDFRQSLLRGRLRYYKSIDDIIGPAVYTEHDFRLMIDGRVALECLLDPGTDDGSTLTSKNRRRFGTEIEVGYVVQKTDQELWHDALTQAGAEQGPSYFNGYPLNSQLEIRTRFRTFLRDFAIFAGGYVFEDRLGRYRFIAARAGRTFMIDEQVNPADKVVLEQDVYGKVGNIRNIIATDEVVQQTTHNFTIGTQSVTIDADSSTNGVFRSARGDLIQNWQLNANLPDGVDLQKDTETLFSVEYSALNTNTTPVSFTITATGTRSSINRKIPLRDRRPDSEAIYGPVAFKNYPEWAPNLASLYAELNRRRSILRVAEMEIPVTEDNKDWIWYDNGTLVEVVEDGQRIPMIIMRAGYNIEGDARPWIRLLWELIELPVNTVGPDGHQFTAYGDEQVFFDRAGPYYLDFNWFLAGASGVEKRYVKLAGKQVKIGERSVTI